MKRETKKAEFRTNSEALPYVFYPKKARRSRLASPRPQ